MASNSHPTPFDKLGNMPFHAPKFFYKRSQTDVDMQLRWCPQCAWPGQKHPPGFLGFGCKNGQCVQVAGGRFGTDHTCGTKWGELGCARENYPPPSADPPVYDCACRNDMSQPTLKSCSAKNDPACGAGNSCDCYMQNTPKGSHKVLSGAICGSPTSMCNE